MSTARNRSNHWTLGPGGIAALTLGVVAACTATDDAATTAPSPTEASEVAEDGGTDGAANDPRPTLMDLESALPTVDAFDATLELEERCTVGRPCDDVDSVVQVSMTQPASPVPDHVWAPLGPSVYVTLSLAEGPEDATEQLAQSRDEQAVYVGDFDIPAEEREDGGFQTGERGTGSIEDAAFGSFVGYESVREYALTTLDGSSSRPYHLREVYAHSGAVRLHLRVMVEPPDAEDAEALVERLATDIASDVGGE